MEKAKIDRINELGRLSRERELTDDEKQSGKFSRPIPSDAYNFKVYFKNTYGVWVHPMKKIK